MPRDKDFELPKDIAETLGDVRDAKGPPPDAKARVWKSISTQINAPPPAIPTRGPASAAPAAIGNAVRNAAIGGFAAGLLVGAFGMFAAMNQQPAPKEAPVATQVATAAEATPAPTATPPAVAASTPVRPARPTATTGPVTEPMPVGELSENDLLIAARGALEKGEFDAALRFLGTSAERFPESQRTEMREMIAVHVFIARGDESAALALEKFRAKFPKSNHLPALEEALRDRDTSR